MIKFNNLPALLNDLVAIRIFEPASKLRFLKLLGQFFSISHSCKIYYKIAPDCIDLKKTGNKRLPALWGFITRSISTSCFAM